ncbi:MAG: hypothetical protein ACRDHD_06340 [Candidatus Limnocylindria bacterium]
MLDYRLHYAILAAEDRVRPTRDQAASQNRGVRRVFRVASQRPSGRDAGRR